MQMTNKVPFLNPTESYNTPAIDGPIKAPRENEAVQSPERIPYVPMSSLNPAALQPETKLL